MPSYSSQRNYELCDVSTLRIVVSLVLEISKSFKKIKLPGLKHNRVAGYIYLSMRFKNIVCHSKILCSGILSGYFLLGINIYIKLV